MLDDVMDNMTIVVILGFLGGGVAGFLGGVVIGWARGFEEGHQASEEINLKIFEKALIEKCKE